MKNWLLQYRGVLLPLILAAALVALAWLQYAWLRDLSEGQRDRMKQNASVGADHFASAYSDLLTKIQVHFQFSAGTDSSVRTVPDMVWTTWREWEQTTEFPGLVRVVYWAGEPSDYLDTDKVARYTLPAQIDSLPISDIPQVDGYLKGRLHRPVDSYLADRRMAFESPPLLVVSMMKANPGMIVIRPPMTYTNMRADRLPGNTVTNIQIMTNSAIERWQSTTPAYGLAFIELDPAVLKGQVIPRLIERHLNPEGEFDFRVAIANWGDSLDVFYGEDVDEPMLENADVSVPLGNARAGFVLLNTHMTIDTLRRSSADELPDSFRLNIGSGDPESIQGILVNNGARSIPADTTVVRRFADRAAGVVSAMTVRSEPSWTLYLQHRLGSIDAAAEHFRRRSTMLSLGILSILGLGLLLIVRNNQRSNELARQQMEFVAGVSHELRTPLSVIRSAGDNMLAGLIRDETSARRYGRLIHAESLRLTDLVEQVLEFSGIQAGQRRYEYRKTDLVDHCISSIASLGSRVDAEAVCLHLDVRRPIGAIMADPGALTSVIQNLVTNAVKYSEAPAHVTITVDQNDERGQPTVYLSVRDQGYGIPKADIPHIFDPFFRARGVRDLQIKGNGLGLSIVSSILKQHDATISVQSEVGGGSEFTVAFHWLHTPSPGEDRT